MKIVLLMSQDSSWSLSIASSLHAAGHEIHVLDWELEDNSSYLSIPAIEARAILSTFANFSTIREPSLLPLRVLRMATIVRRLSRLITPDIVVCLYGGVFGLAVLLSGIRPYAVYAVGSDVLRQTATGKLLNRLILGRASIVLANGRNIANKVLAQAPRANVTNLLIGMDTNRFCPGPTPPVPRFFSHRTFNQTYNNEAIIRALSRIPESAPSFEFIFSGGGPDLEQARALADKIFSDAIRCRVKFLGGRLTTEELINHLGASDFFVSMSFSDGTSTCLLEALSCGLFPILSDIPANSDLVSEFTLAATLVPLNDDAPLTDTLLECVRNVSVYRDKAKQNRPKIIEKCDSAVSHKVLAGILETEILRHSSASRPDALSSSNS